MPRIQRLKKLIARGTGLNYEEACSPAMNIRSKKEAEEYFKLLVEERTRVVKKAKKNISNAAARKLAIELEKSDLGYFSGYFDVETMQRVFRLFNCQHPVFGTELPTPKKAFAKGKALGKKAKKSKKA